MKDPPLTVMLELEWIASSEQSAVMLPPSTTTLTSPLIPLVDMLSLTLLSLPPPETRAISPPEIITSVEASIASLSDVIFIIPFSIET